MFEANNKNEMLPLYREALEQWAKFVEDLGVPIQKSG